MPEGKGNRKGAAALAAGLTAAETAMLWMRTGKPGGNVVVRCRQGHLFTTIWIPMGSVKSVRLGWWRFQHCPVAHHWSLVAPVDESKLSKRDQRVARRHHDIRLP